MGADKHLTADPEGRIIVPGMAHFPGGGPENKHCADCSHLVTLAYGKRDHVKRGCCALFQQFRPDKKGTKIGNLDGNRACKYFQQKTMQRDHQAQ